MNEFNPFTTLGIDPNKDWSWSKIQTNTTTSNPNQLNPFQTLWINPNNTDTEIVEKPVNQKDQEVTSMLWVTLDILTDEEKQSYVDALSDEDWKTWKKLKNEWYSFEARKALLENEDSLYDLEATGTDKYFQTQRKPRVEWLTNSLQRWLDWYQDNLGNIWNQYDQWADKELNFEYNPTKTNRYGAKFYKVKPKEEKGFGDKLLNIWNSLVSAAAHFIQSANDLAIHQWLWLYNTLLQESNPTYEKVSWNASKEWYQSKISSALGIWSNALKWLVAVENPYLYTAFWIIGQDEWFMWKVLTAIDNWARWISSNIVDWAFEIPTLKERINQPWNENVKEQLIEWLTFALYAFLGWAFKNAKKWFGETRAWIELNKIRRKVRNGIERGIWKGLEESWFQRFVEEWLSEDRSEVYNYSPELWDYTSVTSKANSLNKGAWKRIRRAWIIWFKEWFKEWYNYDPRSTWLIPAEQTIEGMALPNKEIPTETKTNAQGEWVKTEVKGKEEQAKTNEIVKQSEKLNLSEKNRENLKSNPDLQTAYTEVIKPYIEENWKNNPEWVINKPVEDLVFEIRSGIDELLAQDSNPNRNINQTKLSKFEKDLIKEVQKIIKQKDNNKILKDLWKLTPPQQGLVEKIVPNITQRLTTISQLKDLTKEITKRDLVSKFLEFQAKRPRARIRWFVKKQIYKYISDYWDQKGIQYTMKDIDNFINWLTEDEISSVQNNKDYLQTILDRSFVENWEVMGTKRLKKEELTDSQIRQRDNLINKWYNPDTTIYTINKDWKIVFHKVINDLDMRPANWWYTPREIFAAAWLHLSLPSNWVFDYKMWEYGNWWFYDHDIDLLVVPEMSEAVGTILHEFGHRIWHQIGEEDMMKIKENMMKFYAKEHWLTITDPEDSRISERWYKEKFAEYTRNYFLYGNADWVLAEDIEKTMGRKLGQKLVNQMEKTRNEILDVFGEPNTKKITEIIDSTFKMTDKWLKIIKEKVWNRTTKFKRQAYMDKFGVEEFDVAKPEPKKTAVQSRLDQAFNEIMSNWNDNPVSNENIDRFENLNDFNWRSLLNDEIVNQIKEQAYKDISWIRVNEDWMLVWKYHWKREMPLKAIMENYDEIQLPEKVRELLDLQYEIWEEEENANVLKNL